MARLSQKKKDLVEPKLEEEKEEEEEEEVEEEVEEEIEEEVEEEVEEEEEEEEEQMEDPDAAAAPSAGSLEKTLETAPSAGSLEKTLETAVQSGASVIKWPGWPGYSVFRLIVPVLKVGSIIGRKGELIKKLCEDTKARVRILEGPIGTTERVVLVSGKEEPEAEISAAMEAVLRIFKRINGILEPGTENMASGAQVPAICAIRLLIVSSQAVNLIGKQGSSIKSIQEASGATIRVITPDDRPYYASEDERIVEIQGETPNVQKALLGVVGHLRKFLVDQSILPLFEKIGNTAAHQQPQIEKWMVDMAPPPPQPMVALMPPQQSVVSSADYPPITVKRDPHFLDREPPVSAEVPSRTGLSLYGRDPTLSSYSSGLGRAVAGAPLVTQITQQMQIPLSYAEDIIGLGGGNISYIRVTSGAMVTVQESRGTSEEITVEIKGTSSQVQAAQQLVQDFLVGHKEPVRGSYGSGLDTGYRSSYSQYSSSSYPASSHSSYYGSPGSPRSGGGYGSYRY